MCVLFLIMVRTLKVRSTLLTNFKCKRKCRMYMWGKVLKAVGKLWERQGNFIGCTVVKDPPPSAGSTRDRGSIPGSERSPRGGNGNPLQYSRLGNPTDRGAWRATVHGVPKERLNNNSWHRWNNSWPPERVCASNAVTRGTSRQADQRCFKGEALRAASSEAWAVTIMWPLIQ